MITLGYDLGTSSLKAALLDTASGRCVAAAQYPDAEMPVSSPRAGWAEQDPEAWWQALQGVTARLLAQAPVDKNAISAIGITYQMHGLVLCGAKGEVLRPAIIWCDSRAVAQGDAAFRQLGETHCLGRLLNSPGNFTAAKLRWVQENEPDVFARTRHLLLPGDYLAMRLSAEFSSTASGLSEATLWDFPNNRPADFLLEHWGISHALLPPLVPAFGVQGHLSREAAAALALPAGIPLSYRAGDQPNNAFSLKVLHPGEVAVTAGTSAVLYGVTDRFASDPAQRLNSFLHVNHLPEQTRIGLLLCINGAGMLYAWMRRELMPPGMSYADMNAMAAAVPVGADGLRLLPFGNGAERLLGNRDPGAALAGLDLRRHSRNHLLRAAQEGIVFALCQGMAALRETGLQPGILRSGSANLMQSPLFCEALATTSGLPIALYDTDGALGAARGAAIGAGIYPTAEAAFEGLALKTAIEPNLTLRDAYGEAFLRWQDAQQRLTN